MSDDAATALPTEADLNSFLAFCLDYFGMDDGAAVPVERKRAFKMLFGGCAQTMRFVRGFLLLRDAQLGTEGRVLARSALEHAATMQYSYLRKGGIDRLHRSALESSRSLAERMAKWTGNTDFQQIADSITVPAGRLLPDTAAILDALDPGSVFLRQSYAVLSQDNHVSSSALFGSYIFVSEVDMPFLDHVAPPDSYRHQTTYAVAVAAMMVTWIVAHILNDESMLERLDGLSDDLHLPLRFDDTWARKLRAHPRADQT